MPPSCRCSSGRLAPSQQDHLTDEMEKDSQCSISSFRNGKNTQLSLADTLTALDVMISY